MKHYKSLDSLRGIACICVFLCHLSNEQVRYKTYNIFAAGNEAVILFFVLSGFVLTIAYDRMVKFNFLTYCKKRLFRIYPAYYFAIIFAASSEIFRASSFDKSFHFYVNTILLFPQTSIFNNLDGPSWSLAYELIISIIILPIFWRIKIYQRMFLFISFSMFMFAIYVGYFINPPYRFGFPIPDKLIGIPYYSTFFLLGILLYEYRSYLSKYSNLLMLILSFLLYFNFYLFFHYGSLALTALGSCGVIAVVISNHKLTTLLENRILLFYGKISYSFYILHAIVIRVIFDVLPTSIRPKSLLAFMLATGLAWFSHRFIELPFIKYGYQLFERR